MLERPFMTEKSFVCFYYSSCIVTIILPHPFELIFHPFN